MQQDAVARDQAHVLDQHPRHAVGDGVDPAPAELMVVVDQGAGLGTGGGEGAAQQLGPRVQAIGIGQFGAVEDPVGLLFRRRQMVQHEPVEMRAAGHQVPPAIAASACRAMTIFCTSEAPS